MVIFGLYCGTKVAINYYLSLAVPRPSEASDGSPMLLGRSMVYISC